jgi:O-antigen ligase
MTCSLPYSTGLALVRPQAAEYRRAGILGSLVAGYVALLPYLFEIDRGRLNFAPADCFLLLVLLLAAGQLKYSAPAWSVWHFGIALIFALGSLVAAFSFGRLDRYELLNKDAGLLLPFLSYAAITSTVTGWDGVRRLLRVFIASVVLENLVAVGGFFAVYFFGIETPFIRYGSRLSGMLLDPNAYGGLLVVALVMCEGASWGPAPLFRKPMLWFSRITLAMGILFSFSRSAWIALAVALLLLCAVRLDVAVRLIMVCLLAVPFVFLLLGPRFGPIFESMARRPQQVQERFDLIDAALASFVQHPFLGGGLGSFRLSAGSVAHNTAMWFLADFGIAGLAVLVGFMAWFFRKGWLAYRFAPVRERPLALALLLAHAAMLGLAMGIEAFYQRQWWLVFGLIASSYSLTRFRQNQTGVFDHVHP